MNEPKPMAPRAWSFSALTSYETCPRRHYLTRVSKTVVEPEGEALRWGNAVHEALDKRVKDKTPLPPEMAAYEPIVRRLLAQPSIRWSEEQIALDRNFKRVAWFDNDVWVRGAIDLALGFASGNIALFDWKTGKNEPDKDQLKLFAALALSVWKEYDKASTAFIKLHHNKITSEVYTRDEVPGIWQEFQPRVARYELAFTEAKWPPKPSGLCKNWCPVGKRHCEFCGG